jgi:hypothetical protein
VDQVQIEELKRRLLEATERYRRTSYDDISKLGERRIFEEEGTPSSGGSYCQVEIAILDRYVEDDADVLHVSIAARDEKNMLSAELFFYPNGKVRWNGAVYQYRDGVPEVLS